MLNTRWTAVAAPDRHQTHCSVIAVELTLRTTEAGAIVDTWVERLADASPAHGLLGVMLERTSTSMRVVSAWSRRAEMAEFERGPMHRAAKDDLRRHVLPPTVAVWTEALAALPPDWHEVRRRLETARTRQRPDSAGPSTPFAAPPADNASGRTTP